MTSALRWRWVFNTTPRPLYLQERPGTHCTGAGWGPEPVWTGAKNLALTGIRSPDRPACSESLYRLSYPSPLYIYILHIYYIYTLEVRMPTNGMDISYIETRCQSSNRREIYGSKWGFCVRFARTIIFAVYFFFRGRNLA